MVYVSLSSPGDNNGWPHLFDKYFGMPSYDTVTKSSVCCKYKYSLWKQHFVYMVNMVNFMSFFWGGGLVVMKPAAFVVS